MAQDELPVGRELDRMIAERVFGRDPLDARHGLHADGDIEYHWGYPVGHSIAPHYSTDADAAATIAEAWPNGIVIIDFVPSEKVWSAEFFGEDGSRSQEAFAPTLPLAICRARLAAIPESTPCTPAPSLP